MSPPIRDGSGNSIGSIRLGDGTEISEVRTGAGDVVFSASSLPDSVVAQYDFRKENGTLPVSDQSGNGNGLSNGSFSGVGRTINSNQAGDFSADTGVFDTFSSVSSIPERFVVFVVLEIDSTNNRGQLQNHDGSAADPSLFEFEGEQRANHGSKTIGGPSISTGTPYILTWIGDSTDKIRRNGSVIVSNGSGSQALDGIHIGNRRNTNPFDGAIGLVEIHDGDPSNGLQTREQEIATGFGIQI